MHKRDISLWFHSVQSILVQETLWYDLFQDVPDPSHHFFTGRTHVLGLACGSLGKIRFFPDLRCLLMLPATSYNEVLHELPHVPVGDRMLFKHHRRYHSVLQVGMDVAFPFRRHAMCYLEHQGPHLICSFQTEDQSIQNSNISRNSLTSLSPKVTWNGRISSGYSGIGFAILVSWYLGS